MKRFGISLVILLALFAITVYLFQDQLKQTAFSPRNTSTQSGVTQNSVQNSSDPNSTTPNQEQNQTIEALAETLDIPWEIVFLPEGDMLVTERPGTLLRISQQTEVIQEIEGVAHVGEGGLMGLALHPNFSENNFLYLYLTSRSDGNLINRIERYTFTNNTLSNRTTILDDIPGAQNHDGGRIAFGPDGKLYATTGDAGQEDQAQNTDTLHGKILRLNDDGSVPTDNPFNNLVYSYGHRNPQGLAWDQQGRLWSTEHGPSGFQSGHDELNLIQPGGNYGWPIIRGDQTQEGMISPVLHSGSDDTWAPAGLAYANGVLYWTGLRGQSLYQATINGDSAENLTTHFSRDYGRLRAVVHHNNALYLTTSNTDGRGMAIPADDRIIRIPISFIE